VTGWSKAWVFGRSLAGIAGSNSARGLWLFCISASGWSLVQKSPNECGVSECDREASKIRRPWPLGAVAPWGRGWGINGYTVAVQTNVSSMIQRPYLFINYLYTTTDCAVFMDFYTLNATQLVFPNFAHLQLKNSTLKNTRVSPTTWSFKRRRRNKYT
jgi:hypothetical protein